MILLKWYPGFGAISLPALMETFNRMADSSGGYANRCFDFKAWLNPTISANLKNHREVLFWRIYKDPDGRTKCQFSEVAVREGEYGKCTEIDFIVQSAKKTADDTGPNEAPYWATNAANSTAAVEKMAASAARKECISQITSVLTFLQGLQPSEGKKRFDVDDVNKEIKNWTDFKGTIPDANMKMSDTSPTMEFTWPHRWVLQARSTATAPAPAPALDGAGQLASGVHPTTDARGQKRARTTTSVKDAVHGHVSQPNSIDVGDYFVVNHHEDPHSTSLMHRR
jgi:hypothetical protein